MFFILSVQMFASFIFCGKISIAISSDLTPYVKANDYGLKSLLEAAF